MKTKDVFKSLKGWHEHSASTANRVAMTSKDLLYDDQVMMICSLWHEDLFYFDDELDLDVVTHDSLRENFIIDYYEMEARTNIPFHNVVKLISQLLSLEVIRYDGSIHSLFHNKLVSDTKSEVMKYHSRDND